MNFEILISLIYYILNKLKRKNAPSIKESKTVNKSINNSRSINLAESKDSLSRSYEFEIESDIDNGGFDDDYANEDFIRTSTFERNPNSTNKLINIINADSPAINNCEISENDKNSTLNSILASKTRDNNNLVDNKEVDSKSPSLDIKKFIGSSTTYSKCATSENIYDLTKLNNRLNNDCIVGNASTIALHTNFNSCNNINNNKLNTNQVDSVSSSLSASPLQSPSSSPKLYKALDRKTTISNNSSPTILLSKNSNHLKNRMVSKSV